ncbi:hypothetical protein GEMRC1_001263 [Eukaryota sp. GEM-RC1]
MDFIFPIRFDILALFSIFFLLFILQEQYADALECLMVLDNRSDKPIRLVRAVLPPGGHWTQYPDNEIFPQTRGFASYEGCSYEAVPC